MDNMIIAPEYRKHLHDIIDAALDHGARWELSHRKDMIFKLGDEFTQFITVPGTKITLSFDVPGKSGANGIMVERLEAGIWTSVQWMGMKIGDIVRFREPNGELQHDRGFEMGGHIYREVRDWVVVDQPTPENGVTPNGVRVDPHDFDFYPEQRLGRASTNLEAIGSGLAKSVKFGEGSSGGGGLGGLAKGG